MSRRQPTVLPVDAYMGVWNVEAVMVKTYDIEDPHEETEDCSDDYDKELQKAVPKDHVKDLIKLSLCNEFHKFDKC